MDRYDFINICDDAKINIQYLKDNAFAEESELQKFCLDRLARGFNYVLEFIDNEYCFGPSRFVGYKDNTMEKHTINHGDGRITDDYFESQKLYKAIKRQNSIYPFLMIKLEMYLRKFGLVVNQQEHDFWVREEDISRIKSNQMRELKKMNR